MEQIEPINLTDLQARYNNRWHDVLTINFNTGFVTIKYGERGKSYRVLIEQVSFGTPV